MKTFLVKGLRFQRSNGRRVDFLREKKGGDFSPPAGRGRRRGLVVELLELALVEDSIKLPVDGVEVNSVHKFARDFFDAAASLVVAPFVERLADMVNNRLEVLLVVVLVGVGLVVKRLVDSGKAELNLELFKLVVDALPVAVGKRKIIFATDSGEELTNEKRVSRTVPVENRATVVVSQELFRVFDDAIATTHFFKQTIHFLPFR